MTKKIFGANAISHLIYGLLMLFPFLSILARSAYVTINKNAYESYSDSYISTTENITSSTQLVNGGNYVFNVDSYLDNWLANKNIIAERLYLKNSTIDFAKYFSNEVIGSMNSVTFQTQNLITQLRIRIYDINDNLIASRDNFNGWDIFSENTYMTINSFTNPTLNQYGLTMLYFKEDKLDNAFDYSVKKFVENDNIGQLNFFSFFDGMFVNRDGVTGLYLNFANWYLNYALLVSAVYILFLVLLWFVNFARKLLDGRNSFGHGGF